MEKTYVALSSDSSRDYSFILPFTALFWKNIINFEPIVVLVGDWSSKKSQVVLNFFNILNIPVNLIRSHIGDINGNAISGLEFCGGNYQICNIAQNVREQTAAMIDDNESWLMPGDADLWPLKVNFYQQHFYSSSKAVCYYSNGDHFQGKNSVIEAVKNNKDYQSIPTCHVTMKVKTWKEMYQYESKDILECTIKTLDKWLKPKVFGKQPGQASWESWMSDQRILTENLCNATWFPHEATLITRNGHPPGDRLDRGNLQDWNNINFSRYTDAHLLRVPEENWNLIKPLIAYYLPSYLNMANEYHKEYIETN